MSESPFRVRVQATAFDSGAELNAFERSAAAAGAGAVVSFTGLVRGTAPGARGESARHLTSMTLEHYPGMTERQLDAITAEAGRRWPLTAALVIHRFGRLDPEDPIVFVATASAHRVAAFEAASFLMDWLKTKAPFWKKEETVDGETHWVAAKAEDDARADAWNGS